ncbi:unnamed protein product [Oikopleura dioica]|uniref:Uncharacterized protein n=1 Tax=Oikopleura dioica TaxID=34765 RepID=E4XYI1_OIKDI|nr:unnamed protein product [Oikopleura dioica]CBY40103.1 unnamed protein product [Oikopleura dioica]
MEVGNLTAIPPQWIQDCNFLQFEVENAYEFVKNKSETELQVFCADDGRFEKMAKKINEECTLDWPCGNANSIGISITVLTILLLILFTK